MVTAPHEVRAGFRRFRTAPVVPLSASKNRKEAALERSLSLLMPVQNAHNVVRQGVMELLEVAAELTSQFEILVIDDGSRDDTVEIAVELALEFPQVGVARHPLPLGRAAALWTGFERTEGEIIFVRDAAGALNVHDIPKMWRKVDEFELVLGWPTGTMQRPMPQPRVPWRSWGSQLLAGAGDCDLAAAFQMIRRGTALNIGWPRIEGAALLAALPSSGYDWTQLEIRSATAVAAALPARLPGDAGLRRAPLRSVRHAGAWRD